MMAMASMVAGLMGGMAAEQLSRPVDQDLLGCGVGGLAVGSFDEFAGLEAGSGADERDEVGCVHGAPAVLGGFDELERHREAGRLRAGPFGDLRAVPYGGEGGLDRVRGAQMDPVLGGDRIGRAARWFPWWKLLFRAALLRTTRARFRARSSPVTYAAGSRRTPSTVSALCNFRIPPGCSIRSPVPAG